MTRWRPGGTTIAFDPRGENLVWSCHPCFSHHFQPRYGHRRKILFVSNDKTMTQRQDLFTLTGFLKKIIFFDKLPASQARGLLSFDKYKHIQNE